VDWIGIVGRNATWVNINSTGSSLMFYRTGIEMDLGLCRAVIAVQEVKSETQLPQVDNSHDLKELHVVSQDNERHQLGIEFNNQLPPAAAVSNKNHHPSFVDLASRSESSFAEMTNVDFSREVVPARAEVSPKNMAQEIVDAAYLAGSMDNLAALVVPLHPCKCIPSYPESYSGIK
jgi:hypothetical protein